MNNALKSICQHPETHFPKNGGPLRYVVHGKPIKRDGALRFIRSEKTRSRAREFYAMTMDAGVVSVVAGPFLTREGAQRHL